MAFSRELRKIHTNNFNYTFSLSFSYSSLDTEVQCSWCTFQKTNLSRIEWNVAITKQTLSNQPNIEAEIETKLAEKTELIIKQNTWLQNYSVCMLCLLTRARTRYVFVYRIWMDILLRYVRSRVIMCVFLNFICVGRLAIYMQMDVQSVLL